MHFFDKISLFLALATFLATITLQQENDKTLIFCEKGRPLIKKFRSRMSSSK